MYFSANTFLQLQKLNENATQQHNGLRGGGGSGGGGSNGMFLSIPFQTYSKNELLGVPMNKYLIRKQSYSKSQSTLILYWI